MGDSHFEAVPLRSTLGIAGNAPPLLPAFDSGPPLVAQMPARPLVELPASFEDRLAQAPHRDFPKRAAPPRRAPMPSKVSHRQFQTTLDVSQGARGSCWAFAGVAALEAAYARLNVHVDLSEQYLFHLSKAHENHRAGGGINSLIGFQGGADIVHHLKYWAVPLSAHVPYTDQADLQRLADAIPNTGEGLANGAGGTREQADWFEFDLRHIPLLGRWYARYRVSTFGGKSNFSNSDIRKAIAAGYDVVIDVFDKINNGGHVLLVFGYDDATQTFEIKNSQGLPGFATMKYVNDPQFTIRTNQMYYVTAVEPAQTQMAAMWLGRWETDHDGWRGRLVIRRFLDIRADQGLPGPGNKISLGTWYGEDGGMLDVVGGFVDGGRGLMCDIGGQPFELYLHTRDPYRASGRCFFNNTPFGVVLSRGTAVGAGAGFNRAEAIGLWDMVHDGWRGQLRVGVDPSYVQAADAVSKRAWIEPGAVAHQVDAHIAFSGDNHDQHFQLLVHTREDGLFGGVTSWGGLDWPVEGRMSQNLYTIEQDGKLRWYQHTGRSQLKFEWATAQIVGTGWGAFRSVFGGGDGVIYAIKTDGVLMWYQHDGRNQGTFQWKDKGQQVGTGWQSFRQVFAGDGGVIYGLQSDGKLVWYRHLGRRDGTFRWQGPFLVGTGWNAFTAVTAAPDGCVYGILRDGTLLWYRHYGHDQGYPIWLGRIQVGTGWQIYDKIWATGNGYLYARTAGNNGELWMWRHHGFLTGTNAWTAGVQVGAGWGGTMVEVLTT